MLRLGWHGTGELNITNGGAVYCARYTEIAREHTAVGTVIVDGMGSNWTNAEAIYVGGSDSSMGGTGQINVNNGGTIDPTFGIGGIRRNKDLIHEIEKT